MNPASITELTIPFKFRDKTVEDPYQATLSMNMVKKYAMNK
jgi:hypothetical protein